jgi:hypothetical protein
LLADRERSTRNETWRMKLGRCQKCFAFISQRSVGLKGRLVAFQGELSQIAALIVDDLMFSDLYRHRFLCTWQML